MNISDVIDRVRRTYSDHARADGGDLDALRASAASAPPARSLTEVLSEDRLALIVEPKRSTRHRGPVNPELDVAATARDCQAAGACAISIVTEPELSGGSRDDLVAARSATDLPLLARDFVVDARQVLELRALGADALLVPAVAHLGWVPEDEAGEDDAAHGDHADAVTDTLAAVIVTAHRVGMEVVVSIRTEEELEFAVDSDADAINIDNRDDDGRVDVERTFELLAAVPVGWPVISESIGSTQQVPRLHRAGVDALLLDEGHLDTGLANALAVYADLSLDA